MAGTTTRQRTQRTSTSATTGADVLSDPLASSGLADPLQFLDDGGGNDEVDTETDIPSVLYSNTSKTDLNKTSPWMKRLDFALAREYEADITLTDLIIRGGHIKAPSARDIGRVRIPSGSYERDAREYDFIEVEGGESIRELGDRESQSMQFTLRAGEGVEDTPITVRFANNGGLNLARLARAAYELAIAKGVDVTTDSVAYNGKRFAITCKIRMNNDVDDAQARSYGYLGLFELSWIKEKVMATIRAVSVAAVSSYDKVMDSSASDKIMHPNSQYADLMHDPGQGNRANQIDASDFSARSQVSRWTGDDEVHWNFEPAERASRANRRVQGSWAPTAGTWAVHPTFITDPGDFTGVITTCVNACDDTSMLSGNFAAYNTIKKLVPHVLSAVQTIGRMLQTAPMDHDWIDDADQQERLTEGNRRVMREAFALLATASNVQELLLSLRKEIKPPSPEPGDRAVRGAAPNVEGLVVLRDWDAVDNAP